MEMVFSFWKKSQQAAKLNGWNGDEYPIVIPMHLRGHAASASFICLQGADKMTQFR